jgi:hypothetical protein
MIIKTRTHYVTQVARDLFEIRRFGTNGPTRFENFIELVDLAVTIARSQEFDGTDACVISQELGSFAYKYLPAFGKLANAEHDNAWQERCDRLLPDYKHNPEKLEVRHLTIEIDGHRLAFEADDSGFFVKDSAKCVPAFNRKALTLLWIFILSDQRTKYYTQMKYGDESTSSPYYCPFLAVVVQSWGEDIRYDSHPSPTEVYFPSPLEPQVEAVVREDSITKETGNTVSLSEKTSLSWEERARKKCLAMIDSWPN